LQVVAGEIAPAFEAGFKEGSRHLFLFQATASATMLDRKTLNEFYYGKLSKLRSPLDEDKNRSFHSSE
jgi:hypothetical protein